MNLLPFEYLLIKHQVQQYITPPPQLSNSDAPREVTDHVGGEQHPLLELFTTCCCCPECVRHHLAINFGVETPKFNFGKAPLQGTIFNERLFVISVITPQFFSFSLKKLNGNPPSLLTFKQEVTFRKEIYL